jgi:hypothetical protein
VQATSPDWIYHYRRSCRYDRVGQSVNHLRGYYLLSNKVHADKPSHTWHTDWTSSAEKAYQWFLNDCYQVRFPMYPDFASYTYKPPRPVPTSVPLHAMRTMGLPISKHVWSLSSIPLSTSLSQHPLRAVPAISHQVQPGEFFTIHSRPPAPSQSLRRHSRTQCRIRRTGRRSSPIFRTLLVLHRATEATSRSHV